MDSSTTDLFSPLRPPVTDAPMGPPVRFVRRPRVGSKPQRSAVHHVAEAPDDDEELERRIDELRKFLVRWEEGGGGDDRNNPMLMEVMP